MHDLHIAPILDAHLSRSHFPSDEERSAIADLNDIRKMRQMVTLTKIAVDRICKIVFHASHKQPKDHIVDEVTAENGGPDRDSALALTTEMAWVAYQLGLSSSQRRALMAGLAGRFSKI